MEPNRLGDALSDRYRLEREIRHGGMAVVYLAVDLKHHRRVWYILEACNVWLSSVVEHRGNRRSRDVWARSPNFL